MGSGFRGPNNKDLSILGPYWGPLILGNDQVADEEVDWFINRAGLLRDDGKMDRMDLSRATSIWYASLEEAKKKDKECCHIS